MAFPGPIVRFRNYSLPLHLLTNVVTSDFADSDCLGFYRPLIMMCCGQNVCEDVKEAYSKNDFISNLRQ